MLIFSYWNPNKTINRKEANNNLKPNIEKPDSEHYNLINMVYDDFHNELQLSIPFMPFTQLINGQQFYDYDLKLGLLESTGQNYFCFIQNGKAFTTNNLNNPFVNLPTDSCWIIEK